MIITFLLFNNFIRFKLYINHEYIIDPLPFAFITKAIEANITISCSSIQDIAGKGIGGTWTDGGGNIGEDPLFVDAATANYRLTQSSPCIDAGDNTTVEGYRDLDGNDRIAGSAVDIGAYEKQE